MEIVFFFLMLIFVMVLFVVMAAAGAVVWLQRGRRRIATRFGDASTLIRRHGEDPRFTSQLRELAADPRTPGSARSWLDRLIRYRRDPMVIAPEWVPVLGAVDEITIEAFLLRQVWRSLPPPLWAEHFPEASRRAAKPAVSNGAAPAVGLAAVLFELEQTGRYDDLIRTLERRLPPWPISDTLIDTARELLELDRNLEAARQRGVLAAVSDRMAGEARLASDALWDLADRLTATASFGVSTEGLSAHLQQERERIIELGAAVREARIGLAELMLAGTSGRQSLDRAEQRFRALARTATEIRELDA